MYTMPTLDRTPHSPPAGPGEALQVDCCIAGGGPAGMMLGLLLARAGVRVAVLEKHADFLRDFRGDTIHPSTLELMHELGLLPAFLARPHDEARRLAAQVGDERFMLADFTHLPTHCRFLAFMPQWDFLDFLAEQAKRYAPFRLLMRTEATGLLRDGDRVAGVQALGPDGPLQVRAALVVAADGRHSTLRDAAGLAVQDLGAPMDVLWLRMARHADDPAETFGHVEAGRMLVMIDRGDYWQCALVIAKGSFDALRERGLPAFRRELLALSPWLAERVDAITDWSQVKLLTVRVDRLREWSRPGLLCIGDAAHAMSPVGGVGINLAVQDAVAAANLLAAPLREGRLRDHDLRRVQRRREWPARVTQRAQVMIQDRLIGRVLQGGPPLRAPAVLRWMQRWPWLQRLPARLIGLGVRPEHVRTPRIE
jgi:2-polyprenyl-6-methoxyphenol hydroxylase-like FAD-dependent oxidoreductase